MNELLDRAFQREILQRLAKVYPNILNMAQIFGHDWLEKKSEYTVNLHYLDEHELVKAIFSKPLDGSVYVVGAKITVRGLDFLADDGGVSAILNTITVKLHDDTIRQILIQKIESTEGEPSVKSQLITKIKSLPAEALGKVVLNGLESGLLSTPNLLQSVSSWLS